MPCILTLSRPESVEALGREHELMEKTPNECFPHRLNGLMLWAIVGLQMIFSIASTQKLDLEQPYMGIPSGSDLLQGMPALSSLRLAKQFCSSFQMWWKCQFAAAVMVPK